MNTKRKLAKNGALLSLLLLTGCGAATTHPVQGKVVFIGSEMAASELAGHTVTIETTDIQSPVSGTGVVTEDGTFEIGTYDMNDGAVLGQHRVVLTPPLPPVDEPEPPRLIHSKHFLFDTSGWQITITPGINEVTLQVERPGS
ncbi:MAG: hypothetical protein ACI9G1_000964 [Pirellulaceae bacterium]|jgi:hypothetical protein